MNINEIASNVNRDFLRGNRYNVILTPPATVSGGYDLRLIGENCVSTSLPGVTYGTFDWRNKGPVIRLPYDQIYDPLRMEFYVDSGGQASQFFREWNASITDEQFNFHFFDEYTADVTIEDMDLSGSTVQTFTLINAYVSNVEPIPISYENQNAIERIGVFFTYERFE